MPQAGNKGSGAYRAIENRGAAPTTVYGACETAASTLSSQEAGLAAPVGEADVPSISSPVWGGSARRGVRRRWVALGSGLLNPGARE
jgi:hypothetical protein